MLVSGLKLLNVPTLALGIAMFGGVSLALVAAGVRWLLGGRCQQWPQQWRARRGSQVRHVAHDERSGGGRIER